MNFEGKRLVKTGENTAGYPEYVFRELTPEEEAKKQSSIRKVLVKIGVISGVREDQEDVTDDEVDLSRRSFLKKSAVGMAGIAIGGVLISEGLKDSSEDRDTTKEFKESDPEEKESVSENSERFEAEKLGYKALMLLRKDEVLFVDENNTPVGKPVKLQDFVVYREPTADVPQNQIREDGTVAYNLSPGKMNEVGIPEGGIAGEWLDYVRETVQKSYPNQVIAETFHSVTDFEAALNEDDEPDLIRDINSGKIVTRADIVAYFAKKEVVGAEEYSRARYVKEMVKFSNDIPKCATDEFKRLLPGLCAQESKFNAGVTSSATAIGIMQIIPDTWEQYQGSRDGSRSLSEQLVVAGNLISGMYFRLQELIGEDILRILREQYNSEEDFQKDFLVPATINSYNAGEFRVADGVKSFVRRYSLRELPSGKDLYLAVADHARKSNESELLSRYGNDSREYVTKVYANADVMEEMGLLKANNEEFV
jgi:hypothetical protein